METSQSIGSRVREARQHAKLSLRALAERVEDLDHTAISRIETGQRRVAGHELWQLAEALGTTTGRLLGMPRRSGALAVAARLGQDPDVKDLDSAVSRVTQVIEMEDLLTRIQGPASGPDPVKVDLPHTGTAIAQGRVLAYALREALGLGTAPVADMAELIEERFGTHVVGQPISGEVHGICVTGGTASVILVNTSDRWARQRYTLAHELEHLVRGDLSLYEVTWASDRGAPAERRAESFAAHFLAPDGGIRQVVGKRAVDATVVGELMDYFGMSLDAMCWRLVNLHLLSKDAADELRAGGVRAVVSSANLGASFDRRITVEGARLPPRRLLQRAMAAYQAGEAGVGVVAAVLGESDTSGVRRRLEAEGVAPPPIDQALVGAALV